MPNIKIIPGAKKPSVPKSSSLSALVPRCRAPGGKPPLPLTSSYNKQDGKK